MKGGSVALQLMWLAVAGAVATLCRYGLSTLMLRLAGDRFAWGTLLVNALGCFLFGAVFSLSEHRLSISPAMRLILLTGFMGAFTTFSTFAFDTYYYAHESRWALALFNILAQNVVGILCIIGGIYVARGW